MDRYYTYSRFLKEYFGEKIYKISINGGFTCPNRDGTLSTGGCIFCSEGGSGEYAESQNLSIRQQLLSGRSQSKNKYQGIHYIAYFQAFTNTYTTPERLSDMLSEAMAPSWIRAVALGTRPDCLGPEILAVLSQANKIKPVFVEMGLQTCHDRTASFLNRAYPTKTFTKAAKELSSLGLRVSAHTIAGLPGENLDAQLATIDYLNQLPISGIKISMLNILKNTALATYYEKHPFPVYSMDEYVNVLICCLERLRKDIVVERITGDGPRSLLIAPKWIGHKKLVLNTIRKEMKRRNTWQGRLSEQGE